MTTPTRVSEPASPRRRSHPRARALAVLAALGPGLLAGLSDDDPAGITTYSVLGADHGYRLLWVLLLSTVALMTFHDLGARMGLVTGQGSIGLIRQRYGVRVPTAALVTLVAANIGTATAEFAGIAAGSELLGVNRVRIGPDCGDRRHGPRAPRQLPPRGALAARPMLRSSSSTSRQDC